MHGMYVHHVCMHVYVCTHMHVCTYVYVCVCVFSWKPAEGIRSFGAGLTGGCKVPDMSTGYLGPVLCRDSTCFSPLSFFQHLPLFLTLARSCCVALAGPKCAMYSSTLKLAVSLPLCLWSAEITDVAPHAWQT